MDDNRFVKVTIEFEGNKYVINAHRFNLMHEQPYKMICLDGITNSYMPDNYQLLRIDMEGEVLQYEKTK